LPTFGFGGADLGGRVRAFSEAEAEETLRSAWELGVRYFDTAPWYGLGASEHRVGHLLRERARDEFVVSTKVGRVLRPDSQRPAPGSPESLWHSALPYGVAFDYSYDGIMRSYEDSLQRLGLARVDVLFVHDLDSYYHTPDSVFDIYLRQLETSGWRALTSLRDANEVGAIGFGINERGHVKRFAEMFSPDVLLVAGTYTLVDQHGLDELDYCASAGVDVVIGSPFRGGLFTDLSSRDASLGPGASADDQRISSIAAVCREFNVSSLGAALQFPLAHPSVVSVVVGVASSEEIQEDVQANEASIPASFWDHLRVAGLVSRSAPLPTSREADHA